MSANSNDSSSNNKTGAWSNTNTNATNNKLNKSVDSPQTHGNTNRKDSFNSSASNTSANYTKVTTSTQQQLPANAQHPNNSRNKANKNASNRNNTQYYDNAESESFGSSRMPNNGSRMKSAVSGGAPTQSRSSKESSVEPMRNTQSLSNKAAPLNANKFANNNNSTHRQPYDSSNNNTNNNGDDYADYDEEDDYEGGDQTQQYQQRMRHYDDTNSGLGNAKKSNSMHFIKTKCD